MILEISDHIIRQTGISASDVLLRIALYFFQEGRITLGQAAKMARMHQIEFQLELSKRNIPIHYDESQYRNDLEIINSVL